MQIKFPLEVGRTDVTEEELVRNAQGGDRTALGELLLRNYDSLTRIFAPKIPAKLQRSVGVDDLLQVTFAEAYRAIGDFEYRGEGSVRAWLTQIGKSRLQDMIKAQLAKKRGGDRVQSEKPADMADSMADLLEMVSAGITSPSRVVSRKEAIQALNLAINSLPELYATVIRLRYLEGRSVEQIAGDIERSPNAVRSIAHRAKQELREAFGEYSNHLSRD